MDANEITIGETIPASRKLGADAARDLARAASRVIVAKGKKVTQYDTRDANESDVVAAMLGPTGNLRAPTLRVGKTVLVGFNEDAFVDFFG